MIVASVNYSFDSSTTAFTQAMRELSGESIYTIAGIGNRVSGGPFGVGRCAQTYPNSGYDYVGFTSDPTTVMLEGWFYDTATGDGNTIVKAYQTTVLHWYVQTIPVTGGHLLSVYNGEGELVAQTTSAYLSSVWHYLALKVYCSDVGSVLMYVDDVTAPAINVSGIDVDTRNCAGEYVDPIYGLAAPITHIGWGGSISQHTTLWADVIVKDTTGAAPHNDLYTSQYRMLPLSPTADGSDTGMTPSAGSDHWACVNGQPVSISTHLSTTAAGVRDSSKFTNPSVTGTVLAVVPYQEMSKSDTATRKCKTYLRTAAGVFDYSDEITLSTSNLGHSRIELLDPNGNPWTVTSFGSSGVELGEETTV
ncbi:MAG: hypothetical protein ABFD89_00795 [Bryobacteraceae bacterium]